MNINIDAVGNVFLKHSKIANVRQTGAGTRVINPAGHVVDLPRTRYTLSSEAGQNQFFADLLTALRHNRERG